VVLAILVKGDRILVGRRPAGSHLGGTWEFPGGKVKAGESPEEALRREVTEETGLSFGEAILLHLHEHSYADRALSFYSFLCLDPREADESPPPGPSRELRWIALDELLRTEMPPANRAILQLLEEQFGG
jgi:8-oxo-dGTP diphosphatase